MSTHHAQDGNDRRALAPYLERGADGEAAFLDPAYFRGIRSKRVLAYLIDVAVVLALVGLWWLFGLALAFLTLFLAWPVVVAGAALLPIAYHTYLLGSAGNATLGMRVLDIRLAAWNGREPGYLQALIQTVLFYLTLTPPFVLVLLVALFNDRGRCLHDMLSGSLVVNAPTALRTGP